MRRRRRREQSGAFRGVSARVVARCVIVTRADGIDVVEDLRDYAAFDNTDNETLERCWHWVEDGHGIWWDDPDDGFEIRHMKLRSGRWGLAAQIRRSPDEKAK
jgi:hypothetical protein